MNEYAQALQPNFEVHIMVELFVICLLMCNRGRDYQLYASIWKDLKEYKNTIKHVVDTLVLYLCFLIRYSAFAVSILGNLCIVSLHRKLI